MAKKTKKECCCCGEVCATDVCKECGKEFCEHCMCEGFCVDCLSIELVVTEFDTIKTIAKDLFEDDSLEYIEIHVDYDPQTDEVFLIIDCDNVADRDKVNKYLKGKKLL